MTDPDRTGYHESPDTEDADDNLIDGRTGENRSDGGEQDTVLLTDEDAQRDDSVARPGNSAS